MSEHGEHETDAVPYEAGTTLISGFTEAGPFSLDYSNVSDSVDSLTGGIRLCRKRTGDGTVPIETVGRGLIDGTEFTVRQSVQLEAEEAKQFAAALLEYAADLEEDTSSD